MKKSLILLTMTLMVIIAKAQIVISEIDWTKESAYYEDVWYSENCTVAVTEGEGLIIVSNPPADANYWEPQVPILAHIPALEKGGNYIVKFTLNAPIAGELRLYMNSWDGSGADMFFVIDVVKGVKEYTIDFDNYPTSCTDANLFFQCGKLPGKHIITQVQVFGSDPNPYSPADICYKFIDKGKIAEIISNPSKQYRGIVDIPSKVLHEGQEYTVTKIADNAFSGCTKLASVTTPNSMTSIGNYAFSSCTGLTSVTISNSVTSIGEQAFDGCRGLKTITIPNSVMSLGLYAFSGCTGLTSVTISNSLTSIDSYAFSGCSSLSSITIPNSVKSIGACAFSGCKGLASIMIPSNVTSIGTNAFAYCSGLASITIPSNVMDIEYGAFSHCSGLTSVMLTGTVLDISNQSFANCENLTDVYCLAEKMDGGAEGPEGLNTSPNAFQNSYPQYITLHVPTTAINLYKTTTPWSGFKEIVPISGAEMQKCATPTISIENGRIKFNCETEGAEFVSSISAPDAKNYYDNELKLSYKYNVSVYATKNGFVNSDTATFEITASGKLGDLDGNGVVNVADHVELTKIIMGDNQK